MSRKSNAFLSKMADVRRAAQEAVRKTFQQYLTDTAVIALHRMGWGERRIRKFLVEWGRVYDEYFDALRDVPETDYHRAKLDAELEPLCTEVPLIAFEDRYEFLPEVKY